MRKVLFLGGLVAAGLLLAACSTAEPTPTLTSAAPAFLLKWGNSGDGQFRGPNSVATDAQGNVYVTDGDNHRIQKFTSTGQFITKWGRQGSGDGQFNAPFGVATDAQGNVYVADLDNDRIQKFGQKP